MRIFALDLAGSVMSSEFPENLLDVKQIFSHMRLQWTGRVTGDRLRATAFSAQAVCAGGTSLRPGDLSTAKTDGACRETIFNRRQQMSFLMLFLDTVQKR